VAGPLRDPGPRAQKALDALAHDADGGREPVAGPADEPAGDGSGAEEPVEPLPDAPVGAIEEWSLDQLHRRASEVGLEGRWDMTREELVEALGQP
jgi:hypothetical protein